MAPDDKKDKKSAAAKQIEKIKKDNLIEPEYRIIYDAFGKTLEPVYFWLLDFLDKIGFKTEKVSESMSPSVTSYFFGDMGARRTQVEKRVGEILATVNTVVKSIVNLLYDLKQFDERLAIYKDFKDVKKGAKEELKRVWLDEVDIKKGTGSIHNLTTNQKYEFVTLRDAFFSVDSQDDIDKIDLNQRVKNILRARVKEYEKWLKESERELKQRRKIELTYLKSQVSSLKMYTEWAKPYLKAIKRLGFKDLETNMPQLVTAFNQTWIEITLRGFKEIYVEKELPIRLKPSKPKGPKAYAAIEIEFRYRTAPIAVEGSGGRSGYGQTGNVDMRFRSYAFSEKEWEKLKEKEIEDDLELVDALTNDSLMAIKEDLDKYLEELESGKINEDDEKSKEPRTFIGEIIQSFRTNYGGGGGGKKEKKSGRSFSMWGGFKEKQAKELAKLFMHNPDNVDESRSFLVYNIYKKAHRMLNKP
jgi:hypothetical protein